MKKGFCCIGLFNPKSPENVGSVLRAAGCYGVNSVFYTGVRYDRAKEFVTDTKKVHQRIPLIGIDDLRQVIPLGCTPVAVELVKDRESKTPDMDRALAAVNALRDQRILISATGADAHILKIRPPLVFTPDHAARLLEGVDAALRAVHV